MFTGANGSFQIDNVPAGTYALSVEHNGILLGSMSDVNVGSALVSLGNVLLTDTQQDNNNCGACGTVCGAGLTCMKGSCQVQQLCVPGTVRSCYTGPAGTVGVGVCASGTQVCDPTGSAYGVCTGERLPTLEACDGLDNDCDGQTDEGSASCPAVANGVAACMNATCGVGSCNPNFSNCNNDPVDGCEINVLSNVNNCGACGNVCTGGINGVPGCTNGLCVLVCGPGQRSCGDMCVCSTCQCPDLDDNAWKQWQ